MTAPIPTPLGAHALAPAAYAVIDIETGDAPAAACEAAIAGWKAPANWKPETVEKKRAEKAEEATKKAALLDASPILCLALKTDGMAMVLNGMDGSSPEVPGWMVLPCADEVGLLYALRAILDSATGPDTEIVGHNILGFDLPKIRNAFLRHRMRLPLTLTPGGDELQPTFDTMKKIRAWSMEYADERFVSLDALARVLDIPTPKQVVTGADVPRLHRDGEYASILNYCALDVATTERAYLLMTGCANDLT